MNIQALLATAQQLAFAGNSSEAAALCHQVLKAQPDCVLAMRMLAILARESHRRDLAIDQLLAAVELRPDDAQLWLELGNDLLELGRADDALTKYDRALELRPDWLEARLNRSLALCELDRLEEAETAARQVVDAWPVVDAYLAVARIYKQQLKLEPAIAAARRACQIEPDSAQAHWVLSNYLLLAGHFSEGWQQYEWRTQRDQVAVDAYPYPRWEGTPLQDKTILVHAEQGIGDEIFFASCYGDLIERAGKCVFVCDPRLAPLFERAFPRASVLGYTRRVDREPLRIEQSVDFQIQAGSLPLHFRGTRSQFPEHAGYLRADQQQVALWRQRLDALGGGLKMGISWRAGGEPCQQRARTIPLSALRELFVLRDVTWVNLQYGEVRAEIDEAQARFGVQIHDWPDADPLVDMDGFAAKLLALDLIISVGNATAHLAGSLGLPVWVLVPRVPIWRWMAEGERSPWYPAARVFRQQEARDWNGVVSVVATELKYRLSATQQTDAVAFARENQSVPAGDSQPGAFRIAAVADGELMAAYAEASRCRDLGDLPKAEQICRAILAHAPRHAHTLHLLAVIAYSTRRFELAIASARRAIAAQDSGLFYYTLALALEGNNDVAAAIDNYRGALDRKPHFTEARRQLARALSSVQRFEDAVAEYRVLCSTMSEPDLFVSLGKAQQQLRQYEAARSAYQQALVLDQRCARAWNALGTLQIELGEFQPAADAFRSALAVDPSYSAARNNLGRALELSGRGEEAISEYERALSEIPAFETFNNLGRLALQLGRVEQAIDYLENAVQLRPDSPHARSALCCALARQTRAAAAQQV